MKRKLLFFLYFSIFPILFVGTYFLLIEKSSATRWISFSGVLLAYFFMVLSVFSIPRTKGGVIYGYPKIYVAHSFFVAEFIVGVAFIVINNKSFRIPLIVQCIIIGFYVAYYVILVLSEDYSIQLDRVDARNIYFIKNASYILQEAMSKVADREKKKIIESLYDAVRGSDVKTIAEVYEEECRLMEIVNKIGSDALTMEKDDISNLVDQGRSLLKSRNNKIRLSR